MQTYRLTAFEKTGETIIDEVLSFENDAQAKQKGQEVIEQKDLAEKTHRLVNATGSLILFHI